MVVPPGNKNISSYQLGTLFMLAISFIMVVSIENVPKKEARLSISQNETFLLACCSFFPYAFYVRPDLWAQDCSIGDLLHTASFGHTSSLRKRMKINTFSSVIDSKKK